MPTVSDPARFRSFAEIDADALLHNFHTLTSRLPKEIRSMAVVKANAYGHGAVDVARLLEEKVDFFGVACAEEGLELRAAGIRKPILIFAPELPSRCAEIVENDLIATVASFEDGAALSLAALSLGKRARVHLAVDTGMGRIGFPADGTGVDSAAALFADGGLSVEGVFSHYACADLASSDSVSEQTARFDSFLERLRARGIDPGICHICNSAASIRFEKKYGLCRLGIALYGLAPSEEMERECLDLKPVMTVKSHVIYVKTVRAGTSIGYGHIYTAPSPRRIATVAIGYADGYNRCITEKGHVLIRGKKAPVVGKVCMDQIMVDVTEAGEVQAGELAVILGKDGEAEISAAELGRWAGSFPYEVVSTFMPRVKRILKKK